MKQILPVLFAGCCVSGHAAIIANPSVTGGSDAFGGGGVNAGFYPGYNVFNGNEADYASNGAGDATYLEFTFSGSVAFDTVVVVNRYSPEGGDLIGNYTLTYADSSTTSITRPVATGQGGFDYLGGLVTTTSVRLDVDTIGPGAYKNTGAMEVYFLRTPAGMTLVSGVTVDSASNNPFGFGYVSGNSVNGLVGRDNSTEFASDAGTGTFVTFDLGSVMQVGGFDFIDRLAADAKVAGFDMIFSQDAVFGNGDDVTRNYTGSTQSDEFAGISARYVQYDVTSLSGTNVGLNEMRFYSVVPEPSATLLGGLGMLCLLYRRRD